MKKEANLYFCDRTSQRQKDGDLSAHRLELRTDVSRFSWEYSSGAALLCQFRRKTHNPPVGLRPRELHVQTNYNRLKGCTRNQIGFSTPLLSWRWGGIHSGGTDMNALSQLTSINLLRSLLLCPSSKLCSAVDIRIQFFVHHRWSYDVCFLDYFVVTCNEEQRLERNIYCRFSFTLLTRKRKVNTVLQGTGADEGMMWIRIMW
jgi:hypothetical protein